jgi:hypothetical protein
VAKSNAARAPSKILPACRARASGLRGQEQRCTRPNQDPARLPGESFRLQAYVAKGNAARAPTKILPACRARASGLRGQGQRCTRPKQDPPRLPGESFRLTWPRATLHAPQPRSSPLAGRELQAFVAKGKAARAPTKILPACRARVSGLRGQEQRCTRPNQDPPRLPGESFRLTWPRATLHAPQPRSSPLAGRELQAFVAKSNAARAPTKILPACRARVLGLRGQEQRCTRPNQDPPRLPGESFRLGGQEQRCTRPNQDPARLPGESFRFTWPRVTLHAPQPRSSPLAGREFQVYVAKSNAARAPTKILPACRARVSGLRGQEQRCTRPNQDPPRLPGESFRLTWPRATLHASQPRSSPLAGRELQASGLRGQEQRCTRPNQDPPRLPGESFRLTWPRGRTVCLPAPGGVA